MSRGGRLYGVVAPTLGAVSARLHLHERAARQPIEVRRVTVASGLGLRIVLAADVHADRRSMPRERIAEIVDLIASVEGADLVAMPGDFVGHEVAMVDAVAAELARLDVPVVATLGNHDHYEGAARVTRALAGAGVRVLTNEAFELDPAAHPGVWVVGLDSLRGGRPRRGLADRLVPDGAQAVVLGHEPWLATQHTQALHLAGHTHHGQIRVLGRMPYLPRGSRPFPAGLATAGVAGPHPRFVYTTAGLGSTTVPLRIGAPPEIVVLDV
ncbi:MAG: metallophosphoesterase [Thermoleophilia bacterium]|nr:metallophosphoesterase [Thermoleophilia bacterium]